MKTKIYQRRKYLSVFQKLYSSECQWLWRLCHRKSTQWSYLHIITHILSATYLFRRKPNLSVEKQLSVNRRPYGYHPSQVRRLADMLTFLVKHYFYIQIIKWSGMELMWRMCYLIKCRCKIISRFAKNDSYASLYLNLNAYTGFVIRYLELWGIKCL